MRKMKLWKRIETGISVLLCCVLLLLEMSVNTPVCGAEESENSVSKAGVEASLSPQETPLPSAEISSPPQETVAPPLNTAEEVKSSMHIYAIDLGNGEWKKAVFFTENSRLD